MSAAYGDEKACLSAADDALAKGSASWNNVRRHASTFAGRRAVSQEADQGGWHAWAWAVCDGSTQYQIFFAGRSPVAKDVLAAWKTLTRTATFGGGNRS